MRHAYVSMTFVLIIVLLVLAGAWPHAASGADRISGPVTAQVVRVIDGDTLVVRAQIWPGQHVETAVRLDGIDTPELNPRRSRFVNEACRQVARAAALQARALLEQLVAGGDVALHDVRFGKYAGRVVAIVRNAAGKDVALALRDAGFAKDADNHAGGFRPVSGHAGEAAC